MTNSRTSSELSTILKSSSSSSLSSNNNNNFNNNINMNNIKRFSTMNNNNNSSETDHTRPRYKMMHLAFAERHPPKTTKISSPITSLNCGPRNESQNSRRLFDGTQRGPIIKNPTSRGNKFISRLDTRSLVIASAAILVISCSLGHIAQVANAASARATINKHSNQFFLNEFCDLQSKTIVGARKIKHTERDHSVILSSKNTDSSVRLLNQKQRSLSEFGFSSAGSDGQSMPAPQFKELNCSIIIVAPRGHGLLIKAKSTGLPRNASRFDITLNHGSAQASNVPLNAENSTFNFLVTKPESSRIAINLRTYQPIDWSRVSYDILFTVYKQSNGSNGCPSKKWFDCGDNICVLSSLVCDNNINCPNGSDEMIFYRCYSPLFWSIAASTLIALVLVASIVSIILVVRKRRGLSKLQSSSNNQLSASDQDLSQQEQSSMAGKLMEGTSGHLASNLYLGGFENPVWSNGTLTKQDPSKARGSQQQQHHPLAKE